jgi:DsbC/DsbD-like thiol-disulfide interchange protein
MRLPLRAIIFLSLIALLAVAGETSAQDASAWVDGHRSRVRLVAAGRELAGVEIALDPGFKTYWRHPGEAGLPPTFDWSKSTNAAEIEVLWPAPARSEDLGGVSYGYAGGVVFPVRVRPREAGKPVRLALAIHYGVCKDICIPVDAALSLLLPKVATAHRPLVEDALARVPRRQPLGAGADLAILAVEPLAPHGKGSVSVRVRAPSDASPELFVEAPDGWFVAPRHPLERSARPGSPPGSGRFVVEVLERPREATGPVEFRLTLVAGGRAIESTATLDAARLER